MAVKPQPEETGFFGRWSKRKVAVVQGQPVPEPAPAPPPASASVAVRHAPANADASTDALTPEAPAPSLEDVKKLTNESDYKPFMAGNVSPDVRNAAMKKLFADPQFNVMDGLDIYIDDYSISEPIPESMLRQMVSAKFLKLFDDEDEVEKKEGAPELLAAARDNAGENRLDPAEQASQPPDVNGSPAVSIAEPSSISTISSQPVPLTPAGASLPDHDDTHLRLQPDHAAAAPKAGRGA